MRSRAFAVAALLAAAPAFANPASDALRSRAAAEFYNLNIDEALDLYRQAIKADPEDAAAHRGLASALWTSLTFAHYWIDGLIWKTKTTDVQAVLKAA